MLQSVNDIETLTNGISRKIWQKIMILDDDLAQDVQREATPSASADEPQELRDDESQTTQSQSAQSTRRPLTEPS